MPHFFVDSKNKTNNTITINDSENYRHIARALRARIGENLLLIDENQIQYETIIKEINDINFNTFVAYRHLIAIAITFQNDHGKSVDHYLKKYGLF